MSALNWIYVGCGAYLLLVVLPVVIALDLASRKGVIEPGKGDK